MNFEPPSLYSPSPARRGPRHFDVTWNEDGVVDCPVCAISPALAVQHAPALLLPTLRSRTLFQWGQRALRRSANCCADVRKPARWYRKSGCRVMKREVKPGLSGARGCSRETTLRRRGAIGRGELKQEPRPVRRTVRGVWYFAPFTQS
jgi:hypothetical protein